MHPSFSKIHQKSQNGLYQYTDGNKVKPKSIAKLFGWMEMMAKEALGFSDKTLQISMKIVLKYLQTVDLSPRDLQMTGCVALHIASKLYEKTLYQGSSYCESAMNIFTKEEFEAHERRIFTALGFHVNFVTHHRYHYRLFSIIDFLKVILPLTT